MASGFALRARRMAAALLLLLPLAACGGGGTGDAAIEEAHDDVLKPGPLGDHVMGRADAPVTIVEYASLTCPYCRRFHTEVFPKVKRAYIDTGKVRYVVREFPIGRSSGNAAIANKCAPESKYFELFGLFLTNQPKWVSQEVRLDAIYSIAAKVGLSRAAFDKCLANQSMIDALNEVKQRGRQLGVKGTPTFFINGQKAQGAVTFDEIKAMIESRTAAAGGPA